MESWEIQGSPMESLFTSDDPLTFILFAAVIIAFVVFIIRLSPKQKKSGKH